MKKTVTAAALCLLTAFSFGCVQPILADALTQTTIETTIVNHNLAGAPTVVARLQEENTLVSFGTDDPASLIMTMNDEGEVLGADGSAIGTLKDVYSDYVSGIAIPIVEIKSDAAAEKLIEIETEQLGIADMAVMSSDPLALQKVRTALPEIRGILDCTQCDLKDNAALYEQVKTATLSMANIVVLSEEQSTVENVNYFQYRLKTVWTQLDPEHEGDIFAIQNVVSSGTYGIIADNYKTVYKAYRKYGEQSVARVSANIAHRGLPMTRAENTVSGARAAVDAGATHIEIDVHLTKDKQPVVMHDYTIDRTTNGTGTVASMTLEELRQFQVTKTYGGYTVDPEPIPTAEDFFQEFDGEDVVIVFEIKTTDHDLFAALQPVIEQYDFWDQLVFISFSLDMLAEAHEQMPQVPTASLSGFARRDFDKNAAYFNSINTVVDASMGDMGEVDYYDSTLKDRGYMSYVWTYGTAQDCVVAMSNGIFGLTNNAADGFGQRVWKVSGIEGQQIAQADLAYDTFVNLRIETYAGEKSDVRGRIFAFRDCGTYAEVIAYYTEAEDLLYTVAFRVDYTSEEAGGGEPVEQEEKGCGASMSGGAFVGGAIVALCAVLFRKRREER